jgi:hypothetical protein
MIFYMTRDKNIDNYSIYFIKAYSGQYDGGITTATLHVKCKNGQSAYELVSMYRGCPVHVYAIKLDLVRKKSTVYTCMHI